MSGNTEHAFVATGLASLLVVVAGCAAAAAQASTRGVTEGQPTATLVEARIDVAKSFDTVEIRFEFPYDALPDRIKRAVRTGNGAARLERFAHGVAGFGYPNESRCHIEDRNLVLDPALATRPVKGADSKPIGDVVAQDEAPFLGRPIIVNYEYHCDNVTPAQRLESMKLYLLSSLPGLQRVALHYDGQRFEVNGRSHKLTF